MKAKMIALAAALCLAAICMPQIAFAEAKAADYRNYSDWAYPELEKAEAVSLMTDRVRGNMKANVTRDL